MPQTLRKPMPHQAKALAWMGSHARRALFMEMRLGKTLCAVRWATRVSPAGRKLVVAPLSVLDAWRDELEQEGHRPVELTGSREERAEAAQRAPAGSWCLLNYEGCIVPGQKTPGGRPRPVPSPALLEPWDVLICDESTRVRNPQALTSKVLVSRAQDIPYRLVLSGLPNPQSELDFFQQLVLVYGEFLGCTNYWDFRQRYFHEDWTGYNWVPNKGTRKLIRREVNAKAYVLKLKDAGLGNRAVHQPRQVTLPQKVRRAYDSAEKEFEVGLSFTKWSIVARQWMAQLAGGFPKKFRQYDHNAKYRELYQLLENDLHCKPVVVWFRYTREAKEVERLLRDAGYTVRRITGSVPRKHRRIYLRDWRRGRAQVLLCQVQIAKYGLDFSHASAAVYYSQADDPEAQHQSEKRIEHPKKNEPLLYVYLLAKDTLDEVRYRTLKDKKLTSEQAVREMWKQLRKQWEAKHGTSK